MNDSRKSGAGYEHRQEKTNTIYYNKTRHEIRELLRKECLTVNFELYKKKYDVPNQPQ